jgi:hypothetical protein
MSVSCSALVLAWRATGGGKGREGVELCLFIINSKIGLFFLE